MSQAPPITESEPFKDPRVWDLISSGGARAVHHIESPAMLSLSRMCNVRDIDTLIAIVSVIRPGAANESKKLKFTRRHQGLEPIEYPHPSLERALRSTYGLVVYEEHILQICESFAGMSPGRADLLRRALVKQNMPVIQETATEFAESAKKLGRDMENIREVWELVCGFSGYAFCKAHSTAYGIEAYQAAWLKVHYPAEFMAAVLTNGKGFYDARVYILECHRLGIPLLTPSVNDPGPAFNVINGSIRVPLLRVKGLSTQTMQRIVAERGRAPFVSIRDFALRAQPAPAEMESMIRIGAFDEFGQPRTRQLWEARLLQHSGDARQPGQDWLIPPPGLEGLDQVRLVEPSRLDRLRDEEEFLGFPASGHPLDLHPGIAWETYCPVARLGEFIGQQVTTCGLVIEKRLHHQTDGEPMKFLTLCDWTGIVETELFAKTYKSYGLATVRYPVLEITATVEPYENGKGFSLRVHSASKPRMTPVQQA